MTFIPAIVAILTALLLGALLGVGLMGYVAFFLCGVVAYLLATQTPPGGERVYWGFAALTLLLFVASVVWFDFGRLVLIAPLIVAISYFFARLGRRFTGARA